jgi:hypothetical protein
MCAPVAPPVTVCKHLKIQKKIGLFCFLSCIDKYGIEKSGIDNSIDKSGIDNEEELN